MTASRVWLPSSNLGAAGERERERQTERERPIERALWPKPAGWAAIIILYKEVRWFLRWNGQGLSQVSAELPSQKRSTKQLAKSRFTHSLNPSHAAVALSCLRLSDYSECRMEGINGEARKSKTEMGSCVICSCVRCIVRKLLPRHCPHFAEWRRPQFVEWCHPQFVGRLARSL